MNILKQSTAVDVLIGPFVDSTDGDTEETALTIANTDTKLSKNGQTLASRSDVTSCAHDSQGMYNCELDATDTNTVGTLVLFVHVAGALAVRHEFQVVEEAVYDALFAASATGYAGITELATIDSNVDAILVDTAALNDTKIPDTISLANINAQVDTALTDYDAPTKTELDAGFAALNDLSAAEVNAEVDTALLDYDAPTKTELDSGFAALNDLSAAEVNAEVDTAIAGAALATAANLSTVDTVVDAIKVVTDALGATAAARLALSAGQMIPGTVDTTSFTATTTILEADDITEATADHYIGRIIIFTSGALAGQATDITDYELSGANGKLTYTVLTEAPANNDTFIII